MLFVLFMWYTIVMNYKQAILQETQAFLLSKDVEVDVKETQDDESIPFDMLKFSILIGKGKKKGGLLFSMTIDKFDFSDSLELGFNILRSQLIMYAVQAIKAGTTVDKLEIFVPDFTDTVFSNNIADAQSRANVSASIASSFDIFYRTPFIKETKKKTIKKTKKTK